MTDKQRRFLDRHPGYMSEYRPEWRRRHPGYDSEYNRRKRAEDPVYRASRMLSVYKYQDRKYGREGKPEEYPDKYEVAELIQRPCIWCGERDWHKIGLDRKDNRFGHVRDNVEPCCRACNLRRQQRSFDEFMDMVMSEGTNFIVNLFK